MVMVNRGIGWRAVGMALALLAAGCGRRASNPLDWWHGLEGGVIARDRPPPPGAHDPYPNLATVPPRPSVSSPSVRRAISASLGGQRDAVNARVAAEPLFAEGGAREGETARAGTDGAAPSSGGAPVEAPPVAAASPAAPASGAPVPSTPAAPLPTLPGAPPAPPSLPGVLIPEGGKASRRETVAARPAGTLHVGFAPGSAEVPASALPALRSMATSRRDRILRIVGGGDAGMTREEALILGLARAGAVRIALKGYGAPADALRVQALSDIEGASVQAAP